MLRWLITLWQKRHRSLGIWNRMTEQARRALYEAEQVALSRGNTVVETYHILYALLSPSQHTIGYLLQQLNLERDHVRSLLEQLMPQTAESNPVVHQMSQDAVQAIDTAVRLARRWRSDYIGSPHLLLGLAARGTPLAALLEERFDLTPELLEGEVVRCGLHRLQPPDEQYPAS